MTVGGTTRQRMRDAARGAGRALVDLPVVGPGVDALLDQVRGRLFRIGDDDLRAVADRLDAAGLSWHLAGGWGVDALLGTRTRSHADIDVCVDWEDDGEARAVAALAPLGYEVTAPRSPSGSVFPVRAVLRRPDGRTLDLLMVTSATGPGAPGPGVAAPLPATERTTGTIGGRTYPCIGVGCQIAAHEGFRLYAYQRRDLEALVRRFGVTSPPVSTRLDPRRPVQRVRNTTGRRLRRVWATALVVVVAEAEPVLAATGLTDMDGMPAHVTITYPFLPAPDVDAACLAALRDIAAEHPPFPVGFTEVGGFPGSVHLCPDDAHAFIALGHAVRRQWPGLPEPTGGSMVPHLTVAYADGADADAAATVARSMPPVRTTVERLTLLVFDRRTGWRVEEEFPLGSG
ncbi:MAG: 2'-5' RNA ligase family protein [Acidimicrobiales bacterium]|jgi:2'-5' RNA ligase|nr:2'-5' RNA ligase family protein [Acidimicrobiales bacterium]